jgi:hypothetical protein
MDPHSTFYILSLTQSATILHWQILHEIVTVIKPAALPKEKINKVSNATAFRKTLWKKKRMVLKREDQI